MPIRPGVSLYLRSSATDRCTKTIHSHPCLGALHRHGSSYESQSQLHPLDLAFKSTLLTASMAMLPRWSREVSSALSKRCFSLSRARQGCRGCQHSSGGVSIESANATADQLMMSPGSLNKQMHAKPQSIEYLLPYQEPAACAVCGHATKPTHRLD